jgi:hypothetical protein
MTTVRMLARMQNLPETICQTGRAKNLGEEQQRPARIFVLRDGQKPTAKLRISGKLFRAGVQPGINLGVDSPERGLQLGRVAFRIIDQESGIHAEELREKRTRTVREVRTCPALDLREIGLAQAAADFALHGFSKLLLGHRTAQTTQGTFYGAQRTEFIAESHRRTHILQSANNILFFAISVKNYMLFVFSGLKKNMEA